MQLFRSHLRLAACTARVARLSASFTWLPASGVGVPDSAQSSGSLLRLALGNASFCVQAPLALRTVLRQEIGALPANNTNNYAPSAPDAASRAGF